jgi:hypothetical protein
MANAPLFGFAAEDRLGERQHRTSDGEERRQGGAEHGLLVTTQSAACARASGTSATS